MVLVLGAVLIGSWTKHPEWRLWLLLALGVVTAASVLWWLFKRRRVGPEAKQPIHEGPDSRPHNYRKKVEKNDRGDGLLEGHGFNGELDRLEVLILQDLADPGPDRSARWFAFLLSVVEERAAYHLERLREFGLVRLRGFAHGGGYELTQKGRAYLVERDLI